MEHRTTLHIVERDSRSRAEQARTAFMLGHHAEVYADFAELAEHPPQEGVLLVNQALLGGGFGSLVERLEDRGIWLPVIVTSSMPSTAHAVAAIKAGALDFLPLPFDGDALQRTLARVLAEAREHAAARRRLVEARRRIAGLTPREREVLDWLAEGTSNKSIARELGISPRTVEIHRANMMGKLGASHSAEAVRVRLEAGLPLALRTASG